LKKKKTLLRGTKLSFGKKIAWKWWRREQDNSFTQKKKKKKMCSGGPDGFSYRLDVSTREGIFDTDMKVFTQVEIVVRCKMC
jgi:hypothetical protein